MNIIINRSLRLIEQIDKPIIKNDIPSNIKISDDILKAYFKGLKSESK